MLAVTHPALLNAKPRHVAVELEGRLTRGMTVVDERPGRGETPNVDVAYGIDAQRGMQLVLEALDVPQVSGSRQPF